MRPGHRTFIQSVILITIASCSVVVLYGNKNILKIARNYAKPLDKTLHVNNNPHDHKPSLLLTVNMDRGRLGNKMFKYASLLGIANSTGRWPVAIPSAENLTNIFSVTHIESHGPEFFKGWKEVKETVWSNWDPVFFNLPNVSVKINGYLQSWKYFYHIRDEIRREFVFHPQIRSRAKEIKEGIRHKFVDKSDLVFIGVHVRRRDGYSEKGFQDIPGSYYQNAFDKMKTLLPGRHLVYLVACQDTKWCKLSLNQSDVVILPDASTEIHLAILVNCDHVIKSVGTYGWWAGWLAGGHVIYYKKFPLPQHHVSKGFKKEDYYPPYWIGVE